MFGGMKQIILPADKIGRFHVSAGILSHRQGTGMTQTLLNILSEITDEEQLILDGNQLDWSRYTGGEDHVVDSKRMLKYGKTIRLRPHTRFIDFPPHRHNYVEIIYMCSGATSHFINGDTSLRLKEGDLLLLSRHTIHAVKKAGYDDIAVNFIVLPQFFDYALSLIGGENVLGQFLLGNLQNGQAGADYLHFRISGEPSAQNILESMIWNLVRRPPNSRQINQVSMGLLFLHLLNHTDRLEAASGSQTHMLIVEALREIEENYKYSSLSRIAAQNHVSVAYISRLIRLQTGKTYKSILQEKRLSKAAGLLRSSGQSIADVIDAVGYANSSYFYKMFRRQYGVSPHEYRMRFLPMPPVK